MLNSYYYQNGNALVNNKNASSDPNVRFNFSSPANGIGGGFPILGYAAAASAGLDLGGKPLDSNATAWLTRYYVNRIMQKTVAAGVPAELVVNHVGGQNPVGPGGKYGVVVPYVNRKTLPRIFVCKRICSRRLMGCFVPLRRGDEATHQ